MKHYSLQITYKGDKAPHIFQSDDLEKLKNWFKYTVTLSKCYSCYLVDNTKQDDFGNIVEGYYIDTFERFV